MLNKGECQDSNGTEQAMPSYVLGPILFIQPKPQALMQEAQNEANCAQKSTFRAIQMSGWQDKCELHENSVKLS